MQDFRIGDFGAAKLKLQELQKQKLTPKAEFQSRELLAEVLCAQGVYQDALSLLESPVPDALKSEPIAVRARMTRGLIYGRLAQFDAGFRELDIAARQAKDLGKESLLGEISLRRGDIYLAKRNFIDAEREFKTAVDFARDTGSSVLEAQALGSLGLVWGRQRRFDEALSSFRASLSISDRLNEKRITVRTLRNIAWCQFELGDWDNALETFNRLNSLSTAKTDLSHLDQLINVGRIYQEKADYSAADKNYQEALAVARLLKLDDQAAFCLHNLSQIALFRHDYEKGAHYANQAIEIKKATKNRRSELVSLVSLAQIEHASGKTNLAKKRLLEIGNDLEGDLPLQALCQTELASIEADQHHTAQARKEFTKALVAIDAARSQISQSEYKLSYFANSARFYNAYIDFLVGQNSPLEALRIAELGRAQTLVEGFPDIDQLRPALKRPGKIASNNGSVILSYWLAPEASYLWVVTQRKTQFVKLPPLEEIKELVTQHQKAVLGLRDPLEDANAPGRKLYEMLIVPAAKWIPKGSRVIVIPDSALAPLNFETLIVSEPKPHYWIEDVTLATASSMLLLAGNSDRSGRFSSEVLMLGDPVLTGSGFPPLPHAAEELREIQVHFPQRVSYSRAEATPSVYRASKPGEYSYIHFATHGVSSRQSPLDSAVILSREGDLNKLYAREIVQIPIHARLVTISACHASGSRSYQGEGLVGLAWAFLRAGAQNVIASLWQVDDSVSPLVMKGLYSDLAQGKDPATALRDAKLSLLHSGTVYRKPLYWGTFQLYKGRADSGN